MMCFFMDPFYGLIRGMRAMICDHDLCVYLCVLELICKNDVGFIAN